MFKSDLFLRIDTSLWMSRSFTVTKALGKAPYGLEKFFITLIEEWIASGGAQFIKKESIFELLNSLKASSNRSPDRNKVPSSYFTQKLNQTFLSVVKAVSVAIWASSIEQTVSQQSISTCGSWISIIFL